MIIMIMTALFGMNNDDNDALPTMGRSLLVYLCPQVWSHWGPVAATLEGTIELLGFRSRL